GCEWVSWC
uniref:Contryphan Li1044/Li965 n=1 Tax=Conus lividus TaxID=89426 RepID=COW44_CONLI|nr:RecName: Full=Contryphan Li1044/Li965 [Conus lividus]